MVKSYVIPLHTHYTTIYLGQITILDQLSRWFPLFLMGKYFFAFFDD